MIQMIIYSTIVAFLIGSVLLGCFLWLSDKYFERERRLDASFEEAKKKTPLL